MPRRTAITGSTKWALTALVVALVAVSVVGYTRELGWLVRMGRHRAFLSVDKSAVWVQLLPAHRWQEPKAEDWIPPDPKAAEAIRRLRAELLTNEEELAAAYFALVRNDGWIGRPSVVRNIS